MPTTQQNSPTSAVLGKFIVFEGGEGCGKTTQIQRCHDWLKTTWLPKLQAQNAIHNLIMTREPGGTELCAKIRKLLLDPDQEPMASRTELLLYAADRAQHVEQCLRPALSAGQLVLCDRYTDSTIAYQGYGRGLDLALIGQLNQISTQGLVPDLTFWLDLDVEISLQRAQERGKRDRIEQADISFHQNLRRGFQALAAEHPDRIIRIDASQSIEAVTQAIQTAGDRALNNWFPDNAR
jgi:dTMP kinase